LKSSKNASKSAKPIELQTILFSQGFGTRRECDALIYSGAVRVGDQVCEDPEESFLDITSIEVNRQVWPVSEFVMVALNKPAGFECSQKPKHWPSVLTLLPAPLRQRNKGGLQPVGRLDADTTGLLLLTDNGPLIHRLTSPKHHVPKVYVVTTSEAVTAQQIEKLCNGVVLDDDPAPVKAAACLQTADFELELTLTEGKYHQVKRMIAASGNHVKALHRSQIGRLMLPETLASGQWTHIDTALVS
jgi:16S rRNA pseudouridine516 synthase